MALTRQEVLDVLKECYDPEVPVNIVDLGLIYDVRLLPAKDDAQDVEVDFTLTSPGCPSHVYIGEEIMKKLRALPGIGEPKLNLVWSPPWGPERISAEARQRLGI